MPSSRRFVVPSKSRPLSKAQLAAYEAKRDLAAELLQSVREMKSGQTRVVSWQVIEARQKTGLRVAVCCIAWRVCAHSPRVGAGA